VGEPPIDVVPRGAISGDDAYVGRHRSAAPKAASVVDVSDLTARAGVVTGTVLNGVVDAVAQVEGRALNSLFTL